MDPVRLDPERDLLLRAAAEDISVSVVVRTAIRQDVRASSLREPPWWRTASGLVLASRAGQRVVAVVRGPARCGLPGELTDDGTRKGRALPS